MKFKTENKSPVLEDSLGLLIEVVDEEDPSEDDCEGDGAQIVTKVKKPKPRKKKLKSKKKRKSKK